jgi:hypothetical protein
MDIRRKRYKSDVEKLMSAGTEEEVVIALTKIVKAYPVNFYVDLVKTNPFFNVLIPDIKTEVLKELSKLKKSITKEIKVIESDMSSIIGNSEFDEQLQKLKTLKEECYMLINEVDEKYQDLENLL